MATVFILVREVTYDLDSWVYWECVDPALYAGCASHRHCHWDCLRAVGCFIILRGIPDGDAISHAVLPGVALSFILGINFFVGAIVFGLFALHMIITFIRGNSIIKGDTAIGITFSSFLALGSSWLAWPGSSTGLSHILFQIFMVQDSDKWITIWVSVAVLIVIILFFKELLITSSTPQMAKAMGMKVNFYHYSS